MNTHPAFPPGLAHGGRDEQHYYPSPLPYPGLAPQASYERPSPQYNYVVPVYAVPTPRPQHYMHAQHWEGSGRPYHPQPIHGHTYMSTGPPTYPPGLRPPPYKGSSHPSPMPEHPAPATFHEYWRGRLAPLPGYKSRSELYPMRETSQGGSGKGHKPDLLPPYSFFGSSFSKENPQISPVSANPLEKNQTDHKLDKYADPFVPQYLVNIQKQHHSLQPLDPVPVFPPLSYLQEYLISSVIEEYKIHEPLALLSDPPILDTDLPSFDSSTYYEYWSQLLRWELDAMAMQKEHIVLWLQTIKVAVWENDEFTLSVPSIRENYPRLDVGDIIHFREVSEAEKVGTGRAVEGRVVALRKREGFVHFYSPTLKSHIQTYVPATPAMKYENGLILLGPEDVIPLSFNVTFLMNSRPYCLMENVTALAAEMLKSKAPINISRRWLFPELDDFSVAPVTESQADIKPSQWVDTSLNAEQRLAVTAISLYQSGVPHLISGPPGTGKTKTVVEAVLQIFRVQTEGCILLCAPSNSATDTLAIRLKGYLRPTEMLRLNDPYRTFAEVNDSIKPYCFLDIENNKFALPPWKQLLQYRVVVCSCSDAGILLGAQCTNRSLMAMEREVATGFRPHRRSRAISQPHWTHLLIDEAAQGSEPELLIPISVVAFTEDADPEEIKLPQLTLCGDIHQLGPIIASDAARKAELDKSLLERLFDIMRTDDPVNEYGVRKPSQSRSSRIFHNIPPFTHLVKNYRSNPVILMPPSTMFYNDRLEPCAKNGKVYWDELSNQDLPLKFLDCHGEESSSDERASWYNKGEIATVVRVVKSLLSNSRASTPPLRADQIGVMAPWREQVWKLRETLRKEGLRSVDVGTVEDYQGRENRVIILSCVRTQWRFVNEDTKKGLGLMFEVKRMNVAITRAKELLVITGSAKLLQRDDYWNKFLQFAVRNKLYAGPELNLEMDGSYISRLESKLIRSREHPLDAETQGIVIAGEVARELLRE